MEEQKLKSCISNIYEIRDEMEHAIRNAKDVIEDQTELLNLVKHSKKKSRFKDFISGIEEDLTGYKNQIEVLKEKVAYANAIIELYEKAHKQDATAEDKKTALLLEQVITTMCLMLSIVPTENEQRIKAEAEAKAKEEAEKNKAE